MILATRSGKFPSPGNQLGRLQRAIWIALELFRPNVTILLAKEPQPIFGRPLIQEFWMMRDEDELSVVVFHLLRSGHKPRLYFA